ncbi:DUF3099 domain-containing protein [Glutamicibacter sp. MNS18]|uniref:DUF3099 domain-containing protein n=1 Tax=Glutamicibacter sp. MNS18 TaxID=2989817 RepID=UPI0022355B98|nr:DUF3099 domain-containing protein [Glutamicibacter sp. MNS18]MCW4464943.1 DUF3099 domain-containing protein [Glutamicibacter sp. MNS18]
MAHPRSHRENNPVPVHRITEAHEAHTVDQSSRVRKYTISMTIRVLCFIAAFFTSGPLQWIMLVGAIVLPYIAVVIANRGADVTKREPPAEFFTEQAPTQLETGEPEAGQPDDAGAETIVIDGSWADAATADTSKSPGETGERGDPRSGGGAA